MNKISAVFQLIRVKQYYKNVIIFVGLIFSGNFIKFSLYPSLLLAFLLLCLASSINYVVNDLVDYKADKIHPEKAKNRPLVNGSLSKPMAWIILILLIIIVGVAIIYYFIHSSLFSILIILILATGQFYNFFLKHIAFADIISLSIIYIWRALLGCVIIGVRISPWLTISIFLVAMFLVSGKRLADLELLGEKEAITHKKTYDQYSIKLLEHILIIISTSLFVTYTLYCVLGPMEPDSIVPISNKGLLVFTAPIALFMIIRFLYLVRAKPEIARRTEKIFKDIPMLISGASIAIMIILILYVENELTNGFF